MDDSKRRGAQVAPEPTQRRMLTRLVLLLVSLGAFLYFGQLWFVRSAWKDAVARVEALGLRVGGRDFADAGGAPAEPWIAEVRAAHARGDDLLTLAGAPRAEGMRYSWATRLAGWDPSYGPPPDHSFTIWPVAVRLHEAVEADLAASDLSAATARLADLAGFIVLLQDGSMNDVAMACMAAQWLGTHVTELVAARTAAGSTVALTDLASALAGIQLVDAFGQGMRREGALALAVLDTVIAGPHAFSALERFTGLGLRARRAACEHWADVGEALALPVVERRAEALQRLADAVEARPEASIVRLAAIRDRSDLLRQAAATQVILDDFRAFVGAGR